MSQSANRISYPLCLSRIPYRVSSTISAYKPSLTPSFSTTAQPWHRLQMPPLPSGLTASTTVRQMEISTLPTPPGSNSTEYLSRSLEIHQKSRLRASILLLPAASSATTSLGEDGTAYIAANPMNEVFKVTQKGEVSVVAGGLNNTTVAGDASAALGRTER